MDKVEEITPYGGRENKARQVEEMFDSIAPAYDFMNTAMSFGLHKRWRNRALRAAFRFYSNSPYPGEIAILDVATGTGDVAFKLAEMAPRAFITGIDLSEGMLRIAEKKSAKIGLEERIQFKKGDSLEIGFPDCSFDMVTVAYGVRNFENLPVGLKEMRRVLKPEGTLCIIELSTPTSPLPHALYNLYSGYMIPAIGRLVSGDSKAYSYLPQSIAAAPQREEMKKLLLEAGFTDIKYKSLSFGAVTYYLAK